MKLEDLPCQKGFRAVTDVSLDLCMNSIRANASVPDQKCVDHLNTNGTQSIVFLTSPSNKSIPSLVSQVGIDITLTGGDSNF